MMRNDPRRYRRVVSLVGFGVVIDAMDSLIRNIEVGGRSHLHTLLVFFSVLEGLQLFGIAGIVAGPLVVAVGITVLDMWRMDAARPDMSSSEIQDARYVKNSRRSVVRW